MSVKKSGEGSGFQIGGFDDASLGTVFEGKLPAKPSKMSAEALQKQGDNLRDLHPAQRGAVATGALKTYEFPNGENDLFIDGTEGEYDPVMAALQNGALPGYDPVAGAIDVAAVSVADMYDTPLKDLPDDVFSSSGFMALGDIANLVTRNS